jgi:hypothetical protein
MDDGDDATDVEDSPPPPPRKGAKGSVATVVEAGRAVAGAVRSAGKLDRLLSSGASAGFCAGKLIRMECINFMCHERMALEFVSTACGVAWRGVMRCGCSMGRWGALVF